MDPRNFVKMHGLGNDFIVLNCLDCQFDWSAQDIVKFSNRYTGIGFDQLLIIEPAKDSSVDFSYRIFNANGSEVEHCGNGARCFGKYLLDAGLFDFERPAKVAVKKGIIEISYKGREGNLDQFEVEMGHPDFSFFTDLQSDSYYQRVQIDGEVYPFGIVSMGNPHAVVEVKDFDAEQINKIGNYLQQHQLFPEQVNVGFMQIVDRKQIRLRVFERGVGETQACGTGACAAVAVGIMRGKLDSSVAVDLLGGRLNIQWETGKHLLMAGPAESVFVGKI